MEASFFSVFLKFCYTMTYYAILEEPHPPKGSIAKGAWGGGTRMLLPSSFLELAEL